MITIVDYGLGNLGSIANMLKKAGVNSITTSDLSIIENAEKLIIPGVGHFDHGMKNLKEGNFIPVLNSLAFEKKIPILGICLGVQLMTKSSEEGILPGLGWFNAYTVAFDRTRLSAGLKVPHMAWADTECKSEHLLFAGFNEVPRFYYVHSYHLRTEDPQEELCFAHHGYTFVSGLKRQNLFGVQFHPEKSHRFGMQLLKNFATII